MTKILVWGDPHINEKSIPELEKIFEEIVLISADTLVCLGDYYDKKHPTTQEILFGTQWADQFKRTFKKVIFIRGNHEKTKGISAVDYLECIGIKVVDNYTDKRKKLHFGHYMLYESKLEYGTGKCGVKDLKQYKKVFLGHQHLYQELKKNKIYHPGSIRFCNFNESKEKYKRIVLLENNKITFIKLKSPYPMFDVTSIKELSKLKTGKKKVRIIISSFEQFKKEVGEFDKYRHKFFQFKVKLDFNQRKDGLNVDKSSVNLRKRKLEDILKQGIKEVRDDEVRKILEEVYNE